MGEDVYVVGIDMIKFGRFPEKSLAEIGADAALLALDDAKLRIQDIEALWCGNLMQANNMVGQQILQLIGQTGIPVVNCANACATGATAFRDAWLAVKAGAYDLVLAVGVEDGAYVWYTLYDMGGDVDEYASVPEYHGELPPGDVVALGANPTVVARLTGAAARAVR